MHLNTCLAVAALVAVASASPMPAPDSILKKMMAKVAAVGAALNAQYGTTTTQPAYIPSTQAYTPPAYTPPPPPPTYTPTSTAVYAPPPPPPTYQPSPVYSAPPPPPTYQPTTAVYSPPPPPPTYQPSTPVYQPATTPSYGGGQCNFGGYRCVDSYTLQQCGYGAGNVLQWESFESCQTGTVCTIRGAFVGCDYPPSGSSNYGHQLQALNKVAAAAPPATPNVGVSPPSTIEQEIANWLNQASTADASLYAAIVGSVQPPGPIFSGLSLLYSARVSTGVQIYTCNATTGTYPAGASSVQATLVDQFTNATTVNYNFTAPTGGAPQWTFLPDNSYVIEAPQQKFPSPEGAIPWVLLDTTSASTTGFFSTVQQVVRYNTQGGVAPNGTCTSGQTAQVPYNAWYDFYATSPAPTAAQVSNTTAIAGVVTQTVATFSTNDSVLYNSIIDSTSPAGPVSSGFSLIYAAQVGGGIQIYTCNATTGTYPDGASSVVASLIDPITGAATVYYNFTVSEGGAPQWFYLLDGSYVVEAPQKKFPSPDGSIPWVLLKTTTASSSGVFSNVKEVIRYDTIGGTSPAGSCTAGQQVGVPYSAWYNFYGSTNANLISSPVSSAASTAASTAASSASTAATTVASSVASTAVSTPAGYTTGYTATTAYVPNTPSYKPTPTYAPTTTPVYSAPPPPPTYQPTTQYTPPPQTYQPPPPPPTYQPSPVYTQPPTYQPSPVYTQPPTYQPTPNGGDQCHFGGYRCKDQYTLQQCGYGAGNVLQWESFESCQQSTVCTIKGNFVGCDFP